MRQHARARYDHSKYIIIVIVIIGGKLPIVIASENKSYVSFQGHLSGSYVCRGSSKILKPHSLSVPVRKYTCSSTQTSSGLVLGEPVRQTASMSLTKLSHAINQAAPWNHPAQ